ncbi:hypothetical protein AHAS_Ahas05G0277000 [Arachis hypogaea]
MEVVEVQLGLEFKHVSPKYASTGMLNERSDMYSFGVLLMEIITGRSPIDYSSPPSEMNLVDWFKGMRLKMGQIVHMLEVDDVAFRYEILTLKEKDNVPSSADVSSKRVPYESKYPKSIRKSI